MMRHRLIVFTGATALAVAGSIVFVSVAAQAPAPRRAAASKYTAPRTAWGAPDLQGIYNSSTATPLQRRPELGDRETLTEEEYAEAVKRYERAEEIGDNPAATAAGNPNFNAYNNFWRDRPRPEYRSSLIVEPKNGRLPPLTAAATKWMAEREVARR